VGENKAFVEKVTNGLKIIKDKYWSSPFLKWQEQMTENNEMLVATIPFVRNVAEFCGHHDIFDALTQFLHFKPDTHTKTVADLQDLFNKVLANPVALRDSGTSVKSLIYSLAEAIITDPAEVVSLEKKIVLSIAIRMKAEEFMVGKIEDDAFWRAIQKNQTVKLIKKFKAKFANDPAQKEALGVLTDVNLMTPESIHVNSFMYEPLLDMSGWHLQELYRRVGRLR